MLTDVLFIQYEVKSRPAHQNLPCVQAPFHLAEKMGKMLGGGEIL